MTDLSTLSDDDLKAMYAAASAAPTKPVASMTDDELKAAYLARNPATAAAPDDIYTQTAKKEFADAKAQGIPVGAGYARRAIQGATFNAADEVLAAGQTPFEMIKRGTFDPREGYKYAKAREDVELDDARKNQGLGGTAAEIGGAILSGSGLARGGASLFGRLAPNAGIGARSAAAAGDAAAYGGVSGGLEGNSLSERAGNAATGAAVGGVLGGVAPVAGALISSAAAPIVSNIAARSDPTGYARRQVARALTESGQTPAEVARSVELAANDGQGMFALADAMGNPGQRMLSSVTRAPGAGRTEAVDFLNSRQAGQARRVASTLSEGFDAPQTAAQTEARLTGARDTAANAEYGAVRNDANPVDLSRAIAHVDQTLTPGVNQIARPASGIANDSAEAALQHFRDRLTDGRSVLTDFTAVQRVRGDLSDAVQAATRAGAGNKARLLGGLLRQIDSAMENSSAGHLAANQNFAQASRNIEAVDAGRTAAMRGRTEDTIPAFRALPPQGQAAYRAGYADPLIADAQKSPFGTNAARTLTSPAFMDEAAAIAPMRLGQQMTNRIGRENTMFETRNAAMGGSKTADNLADEGAMGIDPSIIGQLLTGNIGGVARTALQAGRNAMTGNTPAVREEVGRILTMRGGNVTPQELQRILDEATQRIAARQAIAAQLGRGAAAGVSVVPSATRARQ